MSLRKLLMSGGSQAAIASAVDGIKLPELPTKTEWDVSQQRSVTRLFRIGPVETTKRTLEGG